MFIRLTFLVLLVCSGCQSGIIPCPTVKVAKVKKSKPYRPSPTSFSARAEIESENLHNKTNKADDDRFKNISAEEWDCPRPGEKKYMPKNVKDNIRKNMRKINSSSKAAVDSLQTK